MKKETFEEAKRLEKAINNTKEDLEAMERSELQYLNDPSEIDSKFIEFKKSASDIMEKRIELFKMQLLEL